MGSIAIYYVISFVFKIPLLCLDENIGTTAISASEVYTYFDYLKDFFCT